MNYCHTSKPTDNKLAVDNRLLAPSRSDYCNYNP